MTETTAPDNRMKDISFILKDLLKVIKVVSMYPVDNPLPQSMKQSFAEKLVSLVEQYGQIAVSVQKDLLSVDNEVVYQDRSKEERLAGIFFEAGITDFIFKEGLAVDDVYKLLEAIRGYVNSPPQSQDLASRIWEQAVNGFTFTTLEDIALSEYDSSFDIQEYIEEHCSDRSGNVQFGTDETEPYQSIFELGDEASEVGLEEGSSDVNADHSGQASREQSERSMFYAVSGGDSPGTVPEGKGGVGASPGAAEAARAMGFDDLATSEPAPPDTTLIPNKEFKLSDEEETNVIQLVRDDAEFDSYESTAEILKEMLHQETEMDGFYETVTICEKMMTEFLSDGRLIEAGRLLRFLMQLEEKIRSDKPLWAERLKDAHVTAGSRDRLKALSSALNNRPDIGAVELKQYLDNFGWEALSGITDLLGDFDHRLHREALCDYLTTKGRNHPDIVAKGIYDKRWYVVRNSASILARIGDDRSLEHLKQAVKHEERRVRLEIVTALKDCDNDKALEILAEAVMDSDREIRQNTINAIIARHGRPAFETIAAIINDERFGSLEPGEQEALLKAFSILGGDVAVGYLSRLIEQYNPLSDSTLTFYRQAAFDALSHNRSEKAEKLLVKFASSWRPDIRRRAAAALRRRREIVFGGDR